MSVLDYKYISQLVVRAQIGDSNAFAELYAATYQRQYYFSYQYLKDEHLAQDALQETYYLALKNLLKLKDPNLVVAWLNQINFRVCYNMSQKQKRFNLEMDEFQEAARSAPADHLSNPINEVLKIDSQEYLMNQILKLPFTESQVIILKYYQNMKTNEIAEMMDISRSSVNRYLNSGKERLKQLGGIVDLC